MNFKQEMSNFKNTAVNFGSKAINYISDAAIKTGEWLSDNPEAVAAIAVPIIVSGIHAGQSLIVSHREKQKIDRADFKWYDRSTGLRWDLKRKMTNNDRMAITKMKSEGMKSIDILMKLNLI